MKNRHFMLKEQHHEVPVRLETQTDWDEFTRLANKEEAEIYLYNSKADILVNVKSALGMCLIRNSTDFRHLYYVSEASMPTSMIRFIQETDYDFDK